MSKLFNEAMQTLVTDFTDNVATLKGREALASELERTFGNDEDISMSIRFGASISFSGDKRRLAAVLRKVRKMGFEWRKENLPKEPKEYVTVCCHRGDDYRTREYLDVHFSSTACERVKVGEREVVRTEPVYEMRCK